MVSLIITVFLIFTQFQLPRGDLDGYADWRRRPNKLVVCEGEVAKFNWEYNDMKYETFESARIFYLEDEIRNTERNIVKLKSNHEAKDEEYLDRVHLTKSLNGSLTFQLSNVTITDGRIYEVEVIFPKIFITAKTELEILPALDCPDKELYFKPLTYKLEKTNSDNKPSWPFALQWNECTDEDGECEHVAVVIPAAKPSVTCSIFSNGYVLTSCEGLAQRHYFCVAAIPSNKTARVQCKFVAYKNSMTIIHYNETECERKNTEKTETTDTYKEETQAYPNELYWAFLICFLIILVLSLVPFILYYLRIIRGNKHAEGVGNVSGEATTSNAPIVPETKKLPSRTELHEEVKTGLLDVAVQVCDPYNTRTVQTFKQPFEV